MMAALFNVFSIFVEFRHIRHCAFSSVLLIALFIQRLQTFRFILVTFLRYLMFLPRCMKCGRGLAMRILSVCLSVCPSDKRVHCDKTEETSVQIFIPCDR